MSENRQFRTTKGNVRHQSTPQIKRQFSTSNIPTNKKKVLFNIEGSHISKNNARHRTTPTSTGNVRIERSHILKGKV